MRTPSRFKQRGYLYLSTGANGAGKTLFTVFDVRQLQIATNRPVYYKGFTALQPIKDFGWIEHDMKDWQSLPDGSICIWDEAQDDIVSQTAEKATEWEKAIASQHRKRGFDFFIITQHPMNLGAFVRRLIAAPGWHRHFKASSMLLNSAECKWSTVKTQPEQPNSGASGTVTNRTHPKEAYDWYKSSVVDTAVRKIPMRVWIAIAAMLGAVAMIAGAVWWFNHSVGAPVAPRPRPGTETPAAAPIAPAKGKTEEKHVMTAAEYAASFTPRVDGLAFSAPRYDGLNQPKQAPKPAACLDGTRPGKKGRTCACWTQQATPLDVPDAVCRQIASSGFFDDTLEPTPKASSSQAKPVSHSQPMPRIVSEAPDQFQALNAQPLLSPPDTKSTVERDGEVMAFMRKREYIK